MKTIIKDTERGYLLNNGNFERVLLSGEHSFFSFRKKVTTTKAKGKVQLNDLELYTLQRDENFAKETVNIDVPDNHFAIAFEDGRVNEVLLPGTHVFWNIFSQFTFKLFDTRQICVEQETKSLLRLIPTTFYKKVEIEDGKVGILHLDGKFQQVLEKGVHYFWNGPTNVTIQQIDLRMQQLEISGQEILTADKVSLRLNFVCMYKIIDPMAINSQLKDYEKQIYITTQLILREFVGRYKFDELLEQKENIASFVLEKLQEKQSTLFVEFSGAGLKDIILPGEVRDIMNMVLIAEKQAQANVIARREEVASTRSLLNTAKLMEENKTLYKLKELEYLEKICDKVGNISVGNGNLLSQLGDILQVN